MGFHVCPYLTFDEAKKLKLRNLDAYHSSGDVTLVFASGNSWRMPDMARLYVELGWLPPEDFINDVMNADLADGKRVQTRGITKETVSVGYLSPEKDPLPHPFEKHPRLPEGFLEKLEQHMKTASEIGYKKNPNGPSTGRMQTKGFKPPKF